MVNPSFPFFSNPRTRTEFNATLLKLTKSFESQGVSRNDAKRLTSQIISFKRQGLTDSQIEKNLLQDKVFQDEKNTETQKELQDARNSQKDLLEQLKKEKLQRAKLQAERKTRDSRFDRTKEQVRNFGKTKVILVANPKNPRGPLIPKSQADKIRIELSKQGKNTRQTSLSQKNNPSIITKIRESLKPKSDDEATVIGVNRGFVQLSNGNLVKRDEFKGKIPEKFLVNNTGKVIQNNATKEDVERNKAVIINPSSRRDPTKATKKTNSDPTKASSKSSSSRTKRPSKSVFQNDKPETFPVKETIDAVKDFVGSITNPIPQAKAEDNKKEIPFDPLKGIVDFFTPKPKDIPKESSPIPKPQSDIPKPETQTKPSKTINPTKDENKIIKFVKENGLKIAGAGIAIMFLMSSVAYVTTISPKDEGTE